MNSSDTKYFALITWKVYEVFFSSNCVARFSFLKMLVIFCLLNDCFTIFEEKVTDDVIQGGRGGL